MSITDEAAIAKAKSSNALHGSHEHHRVTGTFEDGTPKVLCGCGVELKPYAAHARAEELPQLERSEAKTPVPTLTRDTRNRIHVKDGE